MTAIVMNTATGAVTEYGWTFQSVSPQHAAKASGLYTLGGATDAGAQIVAELRGGVTGGERMRSVQAVYLALRSPGAGVLVVQGRTQNWEYPVAARDSGVARATPGKGIRESYLGFGYRNADGADFRIDRIDAEVTVTNTRRK